MEAIRSRKFVLATFITVLAIAVAIAFSAAPVSAASKKTVKLIKGHGLKYYKTGLVKEIDRGLKVTNYKYDSKGRIKEIKHYDCDDGKELENKYTLTYSKKGKLKKVVKRYYDKGKVVKKTTCGISVGKGNRIEEFRYMNRYGDTKIVLECKYDSKGRMKELSEIYRDMNTGETLVENYYHERDSKGFFNKSVLRLDTGDDITWEYTTTKKSGLATKIKVYNADEDNTVTYTYKYKKKKIAKKYVKAVKAQQMEMLYIGNWWNQSPLYYLGELE